MKLFLSISLLALLATPSVSQTMSEKQAQFLYGMSATKAEAAQKAINEMSPGQVMAVLTLSKGAHLECEDVEVDRKFHKQLRGKVNRGVFQGKKKRNADGKLEIKAFMAKHEISDEKNSAKFCQAIHAEISEGSVLGASLNPVGSAN